jgi:hypothetical protein
MYKSKADVDRVIALGKPERVIRAFQESCLIGNQHQVWLDQQRIDYDALYPVTRTEEREDPEGDPITVVVKIIYDPPAPSFEEWLAEVGDDENGTPLREFVPVPVDATEFVSGHMDTIELDRAEKEDRIVIRLLLTLIQILVDKGDINKSDFSAREQELFQKAKDIHGRMF